MIENIYLSDVKLSTGKVKHILENIFYRYNSEEPAYICVSNVHTTVTAMEDKAYKQINNDSFLSITDGMPLVYVAKKFRKKKEADRLTGPDLMLLIINDERFENATHFFYGSTNETVEKMIKNLKKNNVKLNVAGTYSPPFRALREEEQTQIIDNLNQKQPDFIWVGLGAPKQERWMSETMPLLKKGIMIGVGAAFDYHANNIKRAPAILQKLGLEWLFRLMQEPRRLFKRYFITNTKFLVNILIREVLKS